MSDGRFYRSAPLGVAQSGTHQVRAVFSTGAAADRYDARIGRYREVLSMQPAHVRLDRLNAGAPLLDSHNGERVRNILGTVVAGSARIENGRGVATLRFSKRAAVEPIWQDVADGILRSVSIGYLIYRFSEAKSADGVTTRTAIDWEPFEISMVPMPADIGAQLRQPHARTDADRLRLLRLARLQVFA